MYITRRRCGSFGEAGRATNERDRLKRNEMKLNETLHTFTIEMSDAKSSSSTRRGSNASGRSRMKSETRGIPPKCVEAWMRALDKHGGNALLEWVEKDYDDASVIRDANAMRVVMKDAEAWIPNVGLAVAIAVRDVGDALARFVAPESLEGLKDVDVEETEGVATPPSRVETILGGSVRVVFDGETHSVRLSDRVEACRRCVEETSSSRNEEEDAGERRGRRTGTATRAASSSARSDTSGGASSGGVHGGTCPTFASLYAQAWKANAYGKAVKIARRNFKADLAALTRDDGGFLSSIRTEWRRCAGAWRVVQAEAGVFLDARRERAFATGATLELAENREEDEKTIETATLNVGKRAYIGAKLALEKWNSLAQRFAGEVRDLDDARAREAKKSFRDFLKTYDITGMDVAEPAALSSRAEDYEEHIERVLASGERLRLFLLNSLNACVSTSLDPPRAQGEESSSSLDRSVKSFEVRSESMTRDVLLEVTTHLLSDDATAFRRARLVFTSALLHPIVEAFDRKRSAEMEAALVDEEAAEAKLDKRAERVAAKRAETARLERARALDAKENESHSTTEIGKPDIPEPEPESESSDAEDDGFADMQNALASIELRSAASRSQN